MVFPAEDRWDLTFLTVFSTSTHLSVVSKKNIENFSKPKCSLKFDLSSEYKLSEQD